MLCVALKLLIRLMANIMFCYKFVLSSGTYVGAVFRNDLMSPEHNIWYILREEIKQYYF